MVARTVAAFMNAQGGLLVIGADDDGKPLGLDRDFAMLGRKDMDGFQQTLVTLLSSSLGYRRRSERPSSRNQDWP